MNEAKIKWFEKDSYDGLFHVGDFIYADIFGRKPYVILEVTANYYICEPLE